MFAEDLEIGDVIWVLGKKYEIIGAEDIKRANMKNGAEILKKAYSIGETAKIVFADWCPILREIRDAIKKV